MSTKNILYFLSIITLAISCGDKKNVSISGTIQGADKEKIYLEQLNVDKTYPVDSTCTDKKGRFSFKLTTQLPTFYNLRTNSGESVTLLAMPDEQIKINGQLKGLARNYWVDGSDHSLWIKLLNFQHQRTLSHMDSLQKIYTSLPQDVSGNNERQRLTAEWDSVISKQISFSKDFILKHAISPASYYALYQKFDKDNFILTPQENLHSYKIVASSLQALYPESPYTKAILTHLKQINQTLQGEKLRQLIASSEGSLPEIRYANIQNDTLSLSSFKGKYIILDFTILQAEGAPAAIENLRKIYNKFKHKGVEIYQVCLDPNKADWEKAVKYFRINWPCVWDPDGLNSRAAQSWNIQNIPANYIINPRYEIVGKNLSGSRLEDRLKDLIR
ncbi:TlpA disulfide reductase family protein [Odoribacter sp. Z80]|uniref:TlpA disulfide reductase family protein n=1 Tax=Odoribacter sp. Z80 TaxID=2304575 RepID=UPI00137B10D2|nr:TlpA disulfide reductase family protein [Odoribacter sp. Z80]NCE72037.1 AhpC/TSA family protein [Odoribacter sp. Z80]